MLCGFRRSTQLACAATCATLLLAARAQAQAAAACNAPAPTLTVLLPADDPRRALATRLSEHLQTLADVDRCAHITLRPHGAGLELVVESGEGRTASRALQSEAELLRASDALLTLPPSAPAPPPPSPPAPPAPPSPPSPLEMPPKEQPAPSATASAHFEFGLGFQARLGGSPLFLGGGLAGFADVVQGAWLIQVSTRADITTGRLSEPTLSDYYLASTAIGVGVGRRFEFQDTTLDVLASPEVVLETQDADAGDQDVNATASDVRLDLSARWSGPRRANLRAFGGLDLEVSPTHLRNQRSAGDSLPPFPSWTCGLSLGMAWSTSSDP